MLNQPHTVERLVKMGDNFVEHLGLKSAEINPMAPLENRNDDLATGLAHIWIDLDGAPKPERTSYVGWGPRLAATKLLKGPGSEQRFRTAINATCKRRSLSNLMLSPGTVVTKSRTPEWSSRSSQVKIFARG